MLNYNKLYYFYQVAKEGNFSRAADHTYVSQSALSRHISELEQELGCKLFSRSSRGVRLTDAGNALYERVNVFFSRENELLQTMEVYRTIPKQELRIGCMDTALSYQIPAIIKKYEQSHTNLKISFFDYKWEEIENALLHNEIDMALYLRFKKTANPAFSVVSLKHTFPAMLVHESHPLAKSQDVSLSDFKNDSFIAISKQDSPMTWNYTMELFHSTGFTPNIISQVHNIHTATLKVQNNSGVILLSEFVNCSHLPNVKKIILPDSPPLYYELAWKKENQNPYINEFAELLKKEYLLLDQY